MSAYLKFFELERSPFEGEAQAQVVVGTRALRDAFGTIQTGLEEGISRICVSGEQGLGKTSLARALPKLLGESARVALVLDPTISWEASRTSLAEQWGIEPGSHARAHLIEAAKDRRLVLVIDQAEKADEEFLDHLDVVLSYRNERDEPVVQSVLLARLGAREGEAPSPLIWWIDRIHTLQLAFAPLPLGGIESYIDRHLERAGRKEKRLFSEDAAVAIHGYSGGVPGEVSALCERLLREAATRGLPSIDATLVHSICDAHEEEKATDQEEELCSLENEIEQCALEHESVHASRTANTPVDTPPSSEDGTQTAFGVTANAEPPPEMPPPPALTEGPESSRARETEPAPDEVSNEEVEPAATLAVWEMVEPEMEVASERLWPIADPLDAPVTEEELRAIRHSRLTRHLRTLSLAAIVAILCGIGYAMLDSKPKPATSDLANSLARTTAKPDLASHRDPRSAVAIPALTKPTEGPPPGPLGLGGFVSIEVLEGSIGPDLDPGPAPLESEPAAIPPKENSDFDPFSAPPAAPRPDHDGIAEDRTAEAHFW